MHTRAAPQALLHVSCCRLMRVHPTPSLTPHQPAPDPWLEGLLQGQVMHALGIPQPCAAGRRERVVGVHARPAHAAGEAQHRCCCPQSASPPPLHSTHRASAGGWPGRVVAAASASSSGGAQSGHKVAKAPARAARACQRGQEGEHGGGTRAVQRAMCQGAHKDTPFSHAAQHPPSRCATHARWSAARRICRHCCWSRDPARKGGKAADMRHGAEGPHATDKCPISLLRCAPGTPLGCPSSSACKHASRSRHMSNSSTTTSTAWQGAR